MPRPANTHNERFHLDDLLRKKIKTGMLLSRLQNNGMGELKNEMSPGQIRSCEILLAKVMPNLATLEITGDVNVQHILSAKPVQLEAWRSKYDNTKLIEHKEDG